MSQSDSPSTQDLLALSQEVATENTPTPPIARTQRRRIAAYSQRTVVFRNKQNKCNAVLTSSKALL